MIEIIPNWHPIFVHFTVGLLSTSIGFFLLAYLVKNQRWREQWLTVAYWNLWLGGGFAIITGVAGWFAFNSVNHDTPSHEAMIEHRDWALATLGVVIPLTLWSWRRYSAGAKVNGLFLGLLLLTGGLLLSTAWHGAELVYRYGLGVKSLPKAEGEGHGHSHADGGGHDHSSDAMPAMPAAPAPDATMDSHPPHDAEHTHDEPQAKPDEPPAKKPHPHVDDPAHPHSH